MQHDDSSDGSKEKKRDWSSGIVPAYLIHHETGFQPMRPSTKPRLKKEIKCDAPPIAIAIALALAQRNAHAAGVLISDL